MVSVKYGIIARYGRMSPADEDEHQRSQSAALGAALGAVEVRDERPVAHDGAAVLLCAPGSVRAR
jgi:hypothetical protein